MPLHLPHEVWLNVAQFLPALVLPDLISLNSSFFEIVMDYRYRQMSFAYLDDRMVRSIGRLQDPAVAKRVRILHVYPGFLKEALERENNLPDAVALRRNSLRDRLVDLGNLLFEQKPKPPKRQRETHPKFRVLRALKHTSDVVQTMLDVLGGLPNVTDYYVTWCGLPTISKTAGPFLATVFHAKLRKLSLELSLENVKNLLGPDTFRAVNVEELQLCIHSGERSSDPIRNIYPYASELFQRTRDRECAAIMREHLAPAISALHATLRTLTIQSREPTDLCPMFTSMTQLPQLGELTIAVPVDPPHLGDPQGISLFLTAHRHTLHTLRLRVHQHGGRGLTPDLAHFDEWMKSAVRGVRSLPELRVLDISSILFPVPTSVFILGYFAASLTSVCLTGCYRTYDDVEEVLEVITSQMVGQQLCKLRLGLVSLSPQFVDLLASKLPSLDRLDLLVKYVLPHAADQPVFASGDGSDCQASSQIDGFLTQMYSRRYPSWHLRHMSLLADSLPSRCRSQYEMILEQTFVQCVPSIRTFS